MRFQSDGCPLSKIDTELLEERKLAYSIGLETGFFSASQAHRILNTFNGYHVNQLKRIGQNLVSEFGDARRQELIVVDIDQSARPTYARKRQGATTGKTAEIGYNCYNGLLLFVQAKLLTKNLKRVIVIVLMILIGDINKLSKFWDILNIEA